MSGLNVCPFDFSEFDRKNLAYELVMPDRRAWTEVKKDLGLEGKDPIYLKTNDTRRYVLYKENTGLETIILRAATSGKKSGLDFFIEWIQKANSGESVKTDEGNEALPGGAVGYGKMDAKAATKEELEAFAEEKVTIETDEDGVVIFKSGIKVLMYAYPCCPYCHNRLPLGWLNAEDFAPIALMAPSGSGKTSLLYSMMNGNWSAISTYLQVNVPKGVGNLTISSCHACDAKDEPYVSMMEAAGKMCQDKGQCPDNTDREHGIPPVFLRVAYFGADKHKHIMIVGFYDNSGENLKIMNSRGRVNLEFLQRRMSAEMYLFEPKDLNIALKTTQATVVKPSLSSCYVVKLEEQGDYQVKTPGPFLAGDLLKQKVVPTKTEQTNIFSVYNSHKNAMGDTQDRLKKRQFIGILSKCDLIEQLKGIDKQSDYKMLFDRGVPRDLLDLNAHAMRSGLVAQMILKEQLMTEAAFSVFGQEYGSRSWHCVSALGCDTESQKENPEDKTGGKLKGTYAPIGIAYPLMDCILKRILQNGW